MAEAPELFADLVSNMTSQGGGDDTDSDADDNNDDTYEVSGQLCVGRSTCFSIRPEHGLEIPISCKGPSTPGVHVSANKPTGLMRCCCMLAPS